jgi:hypothetical protein
MMGLRLDIRAGSATTYGSAVKKYLFLCGGLNIYNDSQPITEAQLCSLCWLYCHSNKHTGLSSWISAIADYHKREGYQDLPRHQLYERNRRSLANIYGQIDVVAPAVPISERQLLTILLLLDPEDEEHAQFWLGCLLGYQALLRASEFCSGALTWKGVQQISQGLQLTIPFSKTKRTPVAIAVAFRSGLICITRAIANRLRLSREIRESDPVVSLSYDKFNTMLKSFYEQAFGSRLGISSHSLRRGGTSAMVASGVREELIMKHGRWNSKAWRQYIDLTPAQQLAATQSLQRTSN